jgi:hypothetical protein
MERIAELAEEVTVGRSTVESKRVDRMRAALIAMSLVSKDAATRDGPLGEAQELWTKEVKREKLGQVEQLWKNTICDLSCTQLRPLVAKLREVITNAAVQGTSM